MRQRNGFIVLLAGMTATAALTVCGCAPQKAEPIKTVQIADGDMEPANWGKAYPTEYEMWKKTEQPEPAGKSKYKRGFDADKVTYDKLSEYPYMALLFNGWGFGVEYNEPKGHANMVRDQLEVDSSRIKAGGVCLTCKSPYAPKLQKEMGEAYYKTPFKEVIAKIPENHKNLGVACIDCHDNKDMTLRLTREFTLGAALKDMGVDRTKLTRQDMRSLVCAQCHVTYNIPKDKEMKSVGVFFPWQGSTWGNISVENIIKKIRSDPAYGEWKQGVTGFKMGFIRHPEFELFSNNSVHWKAGASCADCHMAYTRVGAFKASDHRVMSPLKGEMKGCTQCHAEKAEWLRLQVTTIQDRTASLMLRSGYATATVAKLFEKVHALQAQGTQVDKALYDKAKDYYEEAFYRSVFIGAENSVGFHNPTEAMRVLGDATAFATKAEALLRQALAKAGVDVPMTVDLELNKYVSQRGDKKIMFDPKVEIKDPYGVQVKF
ncbi:MAG: ammonia-forming cytochrome c nitrite reductase subunit c552 [Verrucomicrobia bacterium]|nr:ammonia-forming cytochrome c nitrite reductase subunit c552 [Deltaproteobacteria bacterium]